jgi:hypothetical protein
VTFEFPYILNRKRSVAKTGSGQTRHATQGNAEKAEKRCSSVRTKADLQSTGHGKPKAISAPLRTANVFHHQPGAQKRGACVSPLNFCLCLSRACLGRPKTITFSKKTAQRRCFPHQPSSVVQLSPAVFLVVTITAEGDEGAGSGDSCSCWTETAARVLVRGSRGESLRVVAATGAAACRKRLFPSTFYLMFVPSLSW